MLGEGTAAAYIRSILRAVRGPAWLHPLRQNHLLSSQTGSNCAKVSKLYQRDIALAQFGPVPSSILCAKAISFVSNHLLANRYELGSRECVNQTGPVQVAHMHAHDVEHGDLKLEVRGRACLFLACKPVARGPLSGVP
jgi:hypothetical protein